MTTWNRSTRLLLLVPLLLGIIGIWAARPAEQVSAGSTPFIDISDSAFRADIEWLYGEGVTKGCDTTRYCPKDPVTREQMASFLVRMFDLAKTNQDFFTDDETSIHEGDINRLAAAGVTSGCTATNFCPKSLVLRDQMASFLARAADLTVGAGRNYFYDENGNLHEANIDRNAAAGIASGCGQWRYCPSGSVTREQMAAFLHRIVAPVTAPPYPAPPPPTPNPTPTPPPPTVNGNPWGYNFSCCDLIYAGSVPSAFCSYFDCIPNFWNGVGYVMQCSDSMFSLSGGRQGSCSYHGGNYRALLAP